MTKISEYIARELQTAQATRDNASTREVSYRQGYVDALQMILTRAEIIELQNAKK